MLVSLIETASALPEARQQDLLRIAQVFGEDAEQATRGDAFEDRLFGFLEREFGRTHAEQIYYELARLLPGGAADATGKQRPA